MNADRRLLILGICLVAILLSIGNMFRRGCNTSQGAARKAALSKESMVGTFCGEQIVRKLNNSGRVVLLKLGVHNIAALDKQADALEKILTESQIEVVATEYVTVEDPMIVLMILESGFPLSELEAVRTKHADVDAIISLAGAPIITDSARLNPGGPKVIITPFIGSRQLLEPLRHSPALALCVARITDPKLLYEATQKPDLRERVEAMYQVYEN